MGSGKQLHVGASSVLYILGTGTWLAFTTFSGSSYALDVFVDDELVARAVQAGCFSLSFFIVAFAEWRRGPFGRSMLVCAVVVSLALSLLIGAAGTLMGLPPLFGCVAIACMAFGSACGYCQWLRILAAQHYGRAQWYLALGSAMLIVLMFAFSVLPDAQARRVVTFAVLAPVSVVLMAINVRLYPGSRLPDPQGRMNTSARLRGSGMLLPIVCAMALVLITPIASTGFRDGGGFPLPDDVIQPLAHACSLVVLMLVWFAFRKDTTLPQFYCVFLPVFASLVFLLPLLGSDQVWIIVFVGDCSFFFVSILMVTTCLKVSGKRRCSAVVLYGLFAGCVYASNVVQLALEMLAERGVLAFETYATALLLLYVLVIPAFFIVSANRGRKAKEPTSTAPLSDTESACQRLAQKRGLSVRQSELLGYFALGRDVSYIAQALYLSPNTIRSYRKDLYAALGIHSKQELIDLVEAERSSLLAD